MSNMTLNILVRRCLKVLATQTLISEKGQRGTYLYIYCFKFTLDVLQQASLNMAVEVATLIYPVLDIQDASRDSHDSRIIYWATWGLDGSLSVHMFLSLFKLKGTRKSACNIGGTLITLTHILYLYDGQPIVVDNIIKGLSLGEMVLGRVLQYYIKLLKK